MNMIELVSFLQGSEVANSICVIPVVIHFLARDRASFVGFVRGPVLDGRS